MSNGAYFRYFSLEMELEIFAKNAVKGISSNKKRLPKMDSLSAFYEEIT